MKARMVAGSASWTWLDLGEGFVLTTRITQYDSEAAREIELANGEDVTVVERNGMLRLPLRWQVTYRIAKGKLFTRYETRHKAVGSQEWLPYDGTTIRGTVLDSRLVP